MRSVVFRSALFCMLILFTTCQCKKHEGEDKPKWAKKDISDYNDADMERLLDQWEEDEEPLEPDELPEHLRPPPKMEFDPSSMKDPEQMLKASKKGRSLMVFVKVISKYSKNEVDEITKLWQSALHNNHIQAERYMVDDSRAIFMFGDGAQAWDAKDFLIGEEKLQDVTIENRVYHGHHTSEGKKALKEKKANEKKSGKVEL